MPKPTFGNFRRDPVAMQIGDYTCVLYTTTSFSSVGSFSNIGHCSTSPDFDPEPTSGSPVLSGKVYMVKIDYGTMISTVPLYKGPYMINSKKSIAEFVPGRFGDNSALHTLIWTNDAHTRYRNVNVYYDRKVASLNDLIKYQTLLDRANLNKNGVYDTSLSTGKSLYYEWVRDEYYKKDLLNPKKFGGVSIGLKRKNTSLDANDQYHVFSKDDYEFLDNKALPKVEEYARFILQYDDEPSSLNLFS